MYSPITTPVHQITLPHGDYYGTWRREDVTIEYGGMTHTLKARDGITRKVECEVVIRASGASVEALRPAR